ncbi:MAG: flagellar biosynthesis anti-sigma factor FlgM [Rubrivivax sp.]
MKIGSVDNALPVTPAAADRKAAAPSPGAASLGTGTDTVAISAEGSALAAGDGSFDAAKVERLSKAIKDGTYQVNPEAIADKLIANAQELLARTYR